MPRPIKCAIYYWALRDPRDPKGGRVYFGISIDPEQRWREHLKAARTGSNGLLHRAIRKYGPKAFNREFFWLRSRKAAAVQEQNWIAEAKRRGIRTYNLTAGGEGTVDLDPEAKARRSAKTSATLKNRHKNMTPEQRTTHYLKVHMPHVWRRIEAGDQEARRIFFGPSALDQLIAEQN